MISRLCSAIALAVVIFAGMSRHASFAGCPSGSTISGHRHCSPSR